MDNILQYFSSSQLKLLSDNGIILNNDKAYTDDELLNIHDNITNKYLDQGFDSDGDPTEKCRPWEEIIDIFYDKLNI